MVKHSFWQAKWQQNETMWRGDRVNDALAAFLPVLQAEFGIHPSAEVLVPLCGDSPAVRMLYDAGYSVTGVEYVPEAMEALIDGSFPELSFVAKGSTRFAPRLELVMGDFFTFSAPERFSFIYDRAGYVALSVNDRRRYAEVISTSLRRGGIFLSRTAELNGGPLEGPPFSVTFAEVQSAYPHLQLLSHSFEEGTPTQERYIEAGITTIRHLTCVMKKL